jgi:hypothetical protein
MNDYNMALDVEDPILANLYAQPDDAHAVEVDP